MTDTSKTIVVVEDDRAFNNMFKVCCEQALDEIKMVGTIKQAFDYSAANELVIKNAQGRVDFVSIDIALSTEEQLENEIQRKYIEAGGITLLKQIQKNSWQPLSVIVTGEELMSYSIESQKYGVLAFYNKARFDIETYKNAIKSALLYVEAEQLLVKPTTELSLEEAKNKWKQVIEFAKKAEIPERNFPVNLGDQIEFRTLKLTDAKTGLPNSRWTKDTIKNEIAWQKNWGLIRVTLKGFKKFISIHSSQADAILTDVSNLLKRIRQEYPNYEFFIGKIEEREFFNEPTFVIIPTPNQDISYSKKQKMAIWIENEFSKTGAEPFTRQMEKQSQTVEPTFSIKAEVLSQEEERDPQEIFDIIGKA